MPPPRRGRRSPESQRRINHGAAITVPAFVLGFAIFVTYVDVDIVCNRYLLHPRQYFPGLDVPQRTGAAIAILVLHFVFLTLFLLCYARILGTIATNPGYIGPDPDKKTTRKEMKQETFVQSCAPTTIADETANEEQVSPFDRVAILSGKANLPPGAEAFYNKSAFICDYQGLPNYCPECDVYKVDRSHHSSDIGRCTRRMDHFCPWVGGMVCERNHKFFYQFLIYACCYSVMILVVMAYFYADRIHRVGDHNGYLIAGIAIGAMFSVFTTGMVLNTGHAISLGLTTVESLGKGRRIYHIAVLKPASKEYLGNTITYPLGTVPGPDSRTFAILETSQGQGPWDLGPLRNWKDLMGHNLLDFLLPIRYSPFVLRDRSSSEYEFGPVLDRMKEAAGLSDDTL